MLTKKDFGGKHDSWDPEGMAARFTGILVRLRGVLGSPLLVGGIPDVAEG